MHFEPKPASLYAASLVLSCLLVACSSAPVSEPLALPETPASFRESSSLAASPAVMPIAQPWWHVFEDPKLNELEERAKRRNTSLQIAAGRLQQARSLARMTDSQSAPRVTANAGGVRQVGPLINAAGAEGNLFTASVGASYEIDLFNRLGKASEAARLDVQQREALLLGAQLLVQAEVAQTYLALRAADAERAVATEGINASRQSIKIAEQQLQSGSISALELERLRMDLTTTDLEILDLDRRRATLQSALAVLVGDTASAFQMNPQGSWNAVLPGIPPGVPAGVLARRPDLMAGLNAMLAAAARVGASEVSSLPSLTLNGSVGHASPDLDQLFLLSNRAWGLGALLALPLFDGGQRDAAMGAASAELSIARAEYRAQFLGAFKDVEDNLSALRLLDNHAKQQANAVASANRGVRLTSSRYRNGLASMLEVLESQRIEVRTQRREIQVRSAQFQSTVSLIKALGGGWE